MHIKLSAYRAIETIVGRDLVWRLGRFFYLGARRELVNDPTTNGEYALIKWVFEALEVERRGAKATNPKVVVIDVGANIGEWTNRALLEAEVAGLGPVTQVHAFEPSPALQEELGERFARDIARGRAAVYSQAVADKAGKSRFTMTGPRAGTNALSSGSAVSGDEIEVEVSTLDAVAALLSDGDIALVKIDTEGNDFNVIRGAARLLQEARIIVLQFEYNWRWIGFGHWLQSVFRVVEGLPYAVGRLTQEGIEVHDRWHPELEHFNETNYVLLRSDILPRLPHRRVVFGLSSTLRPA
jgi:FkbM family methyltransferase